MKAPYKARPLAEPRRIEAFLYDGDRLVEQRIIPTLVQEIRKPIAKGYSYMLAEPSDQQPQPIDHEEAVFVLAHRHGRRRGGGVRAVYRKMAKPESSEGS